MCSIEILVSISTFSLTSVFRSGESRDSSSSDPAISIEGDLSWLSSAFSWLWSNKLVRLIGGEGGVWIFFVRYVSMTNLTQ